MIRRVLQAALFSVALVPMLVAQEEPTFKKAPNPGESRVRVIALMQGKTQVLKGTDEARNKADLAMMAKALVYPVMDPKYYTAPEPNSKRPNELTPVPPEETIKARVDDLDRFIIKAAKDSKINFDQYDYLVEFGAALDPVLREVLNPAAQAHVRVNAARMLVTAAASGAPAHAAMITDLIANPATPPEILVYALQAAKNLLGAYDPRLQGSLNAGDHTIKAAELVKLVTAIETVINRQTPYGPKKDRPKAVPAGTGVVKEPKKDVKAGAAKKDDKKPTKDAVGTIESSVDAIDAEDAAVIRFIRRDAIRALAQVRYPTITDTKANLTVRPMFTLCRVAVNDGPFLPKLGSEEYGDAVMGLCNYYSLKGVDVDVLLACIAIGTKNFAQGRGDENIAWRGYAASMNNAWVEWQKVITNTAALQAAGPKVKVLGEIISSKVLTPIENSSKNNPASVGLEAVMAWIQSRAATEFQPFNDLKDDAEKKKYTLKPVLATNN